VYRTPSYQIKKQGYPMTIKAILWDLDGTIADSTALHFQAWHTTMHRHGSDLTYQQFIDNYGRNNAEILTEHFGVDASAMIEQVALEKECAFRDLVTSDTVQPLPGVLDWLNSFRRQGLLQVIGSSGPTANIAAIVHAMGIGDYFLALISGTHLPKGKPDPAIFQRCAAVAGVASAECIVIEDSIHGIEAAHRAGMNSVAVGQIAGSVAIRDYVAGKYVGRCVALATLAEVEATTVLLNLHSC
jgi:HAD superfamily hydrolase (TIGR01509 family)